MLDGEVVALLVFRVESTHPPLHTSLPPGDSAYVRRHLGSEMDVYFVTFRFSAGNTAGKAWHRPWTAVFFRWTAEQRLWMYSWRLLKAFLVD